MPADIIQDDRPSTKPRPRRGLTITLLLLASAYVGGYAVARSQHLLVHYSGFAHGVTDNHRIDTGDLGTGLNPAYHVAHVAYFVFTPLRWLETGYWYLRHPPGQPWPYATQSDSWIYTTAC